MFFVRGVILSGVWFARSAEHTESKDPELRTQRERCKAFFSDRVQVHRGNASAHQRNNLH